MNTRKNSRLLLEHLSFTYPEYPGVPAGPVFEDLSLSLPGDGISMILGRPEAGKTTLSRIIAGLIPRHTGGKLRGRVVIPGLEGGPVQPQNMIEHLGIIFQDADEQIIMTRCDYEAAFALESLGVAREEIRPRVSEAFELMGLSGFQERNPSRLSGGEKKKLLLASLIALDPPFWVLDETLEEIDLPTRKRLMDLMSSGNRGAVLLASRRPGRQSRYFSSFSLISKGGSIGPFASPEADELTAAALQDGLLLDRSRTGEFYRRADLSAGEVVLTAEGIGFSYPGEGAFSLAVEGFELRRGETVCLVGRNGCGKSTFGKILCGLMKPEKGRICLSRGDGLPEPAEKDALNRGVGYLFQNPDYQIFLSSVREELLFGLGSLPDPEETAREAAERFSLECLDAPPALLSYGTRKRLQAACYYLLRRRVYILDEADSGLSYGDFRMILGNLSGPEHGILAITHDVDLARAVADRIMVMKDGRLESVYTRGNFERLGDLED